MVPLSLYKRALLILCFLVQLVAFVSNFIYHQNSKVVNLIFLMAMKRLLGEGTDGDFEFPSKSRHLLSTKFKGVSSARSLQDYVPRLEPMIRRCVKEEVNRAMDVYLRSSDGQTASSGSRNLQLQFLSNLPHTVFTGNRIVSEDSSLIKFALYDSASKRIVTSGPYSSMKVDVVVLEGGDFVPDCREDWLKKDFDRKVVQNREGKRPLTTGVLIVSLQDGVGYVGDVSFTDNSRWTRSGKFRLGVKAHSGFDETSVKEGISNAFRVKDHRGESYQKHHPPSLEDEVWRLEKISKDGAFHRRLAEVGISCVRDFLRSHTINQISLRAVLRNISNKKWDAIIAHAATCILDDTRYIYRTAQGTGLLFNSIYKVVEVTFDGHIYHSVDSLNNYQMTLVEVLKQHAYTNSNSWEECEAGPNIVLQGANLTAGLGQQEMQMNTQHPMISSPHGEVGQHNGSFGLAESSQILGLNLAFSNSFSMGDSSGGFYIGEQTWDSKGNRIESEPSPQAQDFTVDDNFEVESSVKGNGLFPFPAITKFV